MIAPVPETNHEQRESRRRWRKARRLVASTLLGLPSEFELPPRRFLGHHLRRGAGLLLAVVAIGALIVGILLN